MLMGERAQVQVRPFRKEDQGVALALQDEFIEEFFPEFVGDPRLHEWNADIYDIYASYMEGDGNFWVVERGSEVVGMGGIRISEEAAPVLSRIRVKKSERGNGYGTLLLRHIEEYCLRQGYRKILVDTENHMTSAVKLYEKHGYRRYREKREEIDGKTYTNNFYEKNLVIPRTQTTTTALTGRHIRLRPRDETDIDFYVEEIETLEGLGEYTPEPILTREEIERQFTDPLKHFLDRILYVIEKPDGTRIGSIEHYVVQPHGLLEIGFIIIPSERGRGYGIEAIGLIVGHLFSTTDVERIQASTNVRNAASRVALERSGLSLEGVMRSFAYNRGRWADYCLYSVLRGEWLDKRGARRRRAT